MAGHNKWSKIKHKKAATDAQKSKIFSKMVKLIKVAAKQSNGDLNSPALKAAIEKAKTANMPKDNIERAVRSASESGSLEEVTYEAYGPGGAALIITGVTDNTNRTTQEIKHLLSKNGQQLAQAGSASWAFSKTEEGFEANTTVELSEGDEEKLQKLIEVLEEHDDVQDVFVNAA